eukprot:COSAG01_NODE_2016_length_8641_cov_6.648911_6_plen_310_part_00
MAIMLSVGQLEFAETVSVFLSAAAESSCRTESRAFSPRCATTERPQTVAPCPTAHRPQGAQRPIRVVGGSSYTAHRAARWQPASCAQWAAAGLPLRPMMGSTTVLLLLLLLAQSTPDSPAVAATFGRKPVMGWGSWSAPCSHVSISAVCCCFDHRFALHRTATAAGRPTLHYATGRYAYGKDGESGVTESMIKAQADLLVSTGLARVGYRLVWPDCDFLAPARNASGFIFADPKRFPSGDTYLANYVHSKGLLWGAYSDSGSKTCCGKPGMLGNGQRDAATFAAWGVDVRVMMAVLSALRCRCWAAVGI